MDGKWGLTDLQRERREWWRANFGESRAEHAVLGVVEEMGEAVVELAKIGPNVLEMSEALVGELSDIVISLVGCCDAWELDAGEVYGEVLYGRPVDLQWESGTIQLGRLARATLKHAHGIRGDRETHREAARVAITNLLRSVDRSFRTGEESLLERTRETWERVRRRDWKRNPEKGVAT